jgi:hypothetical protein
MASPLAFDMELTQAGIHPPTWANPKTTGRNSTMRKNASQEPNAKTTIAQQAKKTRDSSSSPGKIRPKTHFQKKPLTR